MIGGTLRSPKAHQVLADRPATFQEYQMLLSAKSRGSSSEHDRNSGERSDPAWLDERHQVPGTRIVESCATVGLRLAALGWLQLFSSDAQIPTIAPQELLHRLGAEAKTLRWIRLRLGCQAELVSRSPRPGYGI